MLKEEMLEIKNFSYGEYNFSERNTRLLDTSLRDGEQSGVIRLPTLEEEEEFIFRASEFVDAFDLTTPVSRGPKLRNAIALARKIPFGKDVVCLARTHERDIRAALELQYGAGRQIKGIIFVGTSNKRLVAEDWDIEEVTKWMSKNVALAVEEGMIPIVATEHTTETDPKIAERIFKAGLEAAVNHPKYRSVEACIADTTGVSTDRGTRMQIRLFRDKILADYPGTVLHWHGHDDYGMAVANSLIALDEGAEVIHVTTLGIGERSGNTALETMVQNLKRFGDPKRQNLESLLNFAKFSARIFDTPLRSNFPGIGENNRRYASGIHGAAAAKAREKGTPNPYESIPQIWFGEKIEVVVGPVAGEQNAREVCLRHNVKPTEELIRSLLETAIRMNRILSTEEERSIIHNVIGGNGNGNS